jgi:hypothetical protein
VAQGRARTPRARQEKSRAGLQSDARLDGKIEMDSTTPVEVSQLASRKTNSRPAEGAPKSGTVIQFPSRRDDDDSSADDVARDSAIARLVRVVEHGSMSLSRYFVEFEIVEGEGEGERHRLVMECPEGDPTFSGAYNEACVALGVEAFTLPDDLPREPRVVATFISPRNGFRLMSPGLQQQITDQARNAARLQVLPPANDAQVSAPAQASASAAAPSPIAQPRVDVVKENPAPVPRAPWLAASDKTGAIPEVLLRTPVPLLDEIANAITSTAYLPQPALSLQAALAFASTVMGQSYIGPTGLGTNNYFLGIALSGSGKDRPLKSVAQMLSDCGLGEFVSDEPASGSALLTRLADFPNSIMLVDEFGKFLHAVTEQKAGAHQREIASLWLKLSGSPVPEFISKMYADPQARKTRRPRYPCLNLFGVSTPSAFYASLTRAQVDDGLLNRCQVVILPESLPAINENASSLATPAGAIEWAREIRNRPAPGGPTCINGPFNPHRVPFGKGAKTIVDELENESRRVFADHQRRETGLEALTRRWSEQAVKLATVAAGAEDPVEPRITPAVAEWACVYVMHNGRRSMSEFEARVSESPFDTKVKDCLVAFGRAGPEGLTERQINSKIRAFTRMPMRERREVMDHLQEGDMIRVLFEEGGARRFVLTKFCPAVG